MVAQCDLPASFVKYESFRNFLTYLNPLAGAILPESAITINGWIEHQVNVNEPHTRALLQSSISKIHVMADMWDIGYHKHVITYFTSELTAQAT
jgi:hypothetical protein